MKSEHHFNALLPCIMTKRSYCTSETGIFEVNAWFEKTFFSIFHTFISNSRSGCLNLDYSKSQLYNLPSSKIYPFKTCHCQMSLPSILLMLFFAPESTDFFSLSSL